MESLYTQAEHSAPKWHSHTQAELYQRQRAKVDNQSMVLTEISATSGPFDINQLAPPTNNDAQRKELFRKRLVTKKNELMFFAFGVSLLLCWNATMAEMDYFIRIFPHHSPSFHFLLAGSCPMLIMQMVSYFLQMVISVQFKLCVAITLNTFIAALITVMPTLVKDENIGFRIMLGLMFFQGSGVAFMQSALYGIGGVSHKFTNNLMVGVAVGGVCTNLVRIIMKVSVKNQDLSYIVFFSVVTGYLFFCCILAFIFIKEYNECLALLDQFGDDEP